jgi:phosphatidylserine decarboxylase
MTITSHILISTSISSLLYFYLHLKTRISLKYMLKDNLVVILLGSLFSQAIGHIFHDHFFLMNLLINSAIIVSLAFGLTMIRFWRTPQRKINAMPNEIVSPADGKVIYVKLIEAGETPVSIKRDVCSSLEEVTKTNLLDNPCWLMGINMTPFDVHKNCTPIDGKIILNQHFNGKFLSLKDKSSLVENERNTYVIQGNSIKIGVVQIASRLVRRIDSYVTEGSTVSQGDWLGMIRFGSQVDVILPKECAINAEIGQQIYAGKTIIARI